MGPKTLPTIWGTYMKLVTKYQISAINSCEKCDNQQSRQTGSRNLTGPSLPPDIMYLPPHTKYLSIFRQYSISKLYSLKLYVTKLY